MVRSDPFIHMERAKKTYGFTIAVKELKETVPNIFRYASAYKRMNNLTSKGLWEMFADPAEAPVNLETDDGKFKPSLPEEILTTEAGQGGLPDVDPDAMEGEIYNMCHFWSNFEIARLDWFRSPEYNDFFNMMDRSGGFWMERVSDQIDSQYGFANVCRSGETRPSIPSRLEHFCHPTTSTTSETLVIDTLPYSIVQQMRQGIGSLKDLLSWSRPRRTRRSGKRKTSTGKHGTRLKRTALDVGVNVTRTLSMSKASWVAVWLIGSASPAAGHLREHHHCGRPASSGHCSICFVSCRSR